jgi:hypothetical protein
LTAPRGESQSGCPPAGYAWAHELPPFPSWQSNQRAGCHLKHSSDNGVPAGANRSAGFGSAAVSLFLAPMQCSSTRHRSGLGKRLSIGLAIASSWGGLIFLIWWPHCLRQIRHACQPINTFQPASSLDIFRTVRS